MKKSKKSLKIKIDPSSIPDEGLDSLLEQLEHLAKVGPWDYIPHDKQREFHLADYKTRVVLGGNRSGKTECGTMEAWFHASGDYPDWYPKEKRFDGPTRGRIIVTDFKKGCGEVLEPKLRKWFPVDRIIKWKQYMGHLDKIEIRHSTGGVSSIDVLTHEQDDMVYEGWSGHWAWFDEPPPQSKYIATKRGLVDFGGSCWMTLTPISEPWIFDTLIDRPDERVWSTVMTIYDNPHLDKANIEEYAASMPDEEKEARLTGKFRHLVGRVYKSLDASVHLMDLAKFEKIWQKQWPVWFVLDPADRREQHGIWATIDPMLNLYVFDEFCKKGTIEETSKEVLIRERSRWKLHQDQILRILDPNKGNTPNSVTGLKLIEEFAKHALYFTATVNDSLSLGHLAVMERLAYNNKIPLSVDNHPKLYFIRETTGVCWSQMNKYMWDEWRGVTKDGRSQKEVPKDLNKDMPDCVRYLCMSNPVFFDPFETESGERELTFRPK